MKFEGKKLAQMEKLKVKKEGYNVLGIVLRWKAI